MSGYGMVTIVVLNFQATARDALDGLRFRSPGPARVPGGITRAAYPLSGAYRDRLFPKFLDSTFTGSPPYLFVAASVTTQDSSTCRARTEESVSATRFNTRPLRHPPAWFHPRMLTPLTLSITGQPLKVRNPLARYPSHLFLVWEWRQFRVSVSVDRLSAFPPHVRVVRISRRLFFLWFIVPQLPRAGPCRSKSLFSDGLATQ